MIETSFLKGFLLGCAIVGIISGAIVTYYLNKVKEAFEEVELACEDDNYLAISPAIDKFKEKLGL